MKKIVLVTYNALLTLSSLILTTLPLLNLSVIGKAQYNRHTTPLSIVLYFQHALFLKLKKAMCLYKGHIE